MTLTEIIERVAQRQEVPYKLVEGFVLEAVEEIVRVLDQGEDVKIRGLGRLHWQRVKSNTMPGNVHIPGGWKLKFRPSLKLRYRRIDMSDEGFNKYGVELDNEKTKEASYGSDKAGTCPTCQKDLDSGGACPVHGTEPLEPTGR